MQLPSSPLSSSLLVVWKPSRCVSLCDMTVWALTSRGGATSCLWKPWSPVWKQPGSAYGNCCYYGYIMFTAVASVFGAIYWRQSKGIFQFIQWRLYLNSHWLTTTTIWPPEIARISWCVFRGVTQQPIPTICRVLLIKKKEKKESKVLADAGPHSSPPVKSSGAANSPLMLPFVLLAVKLGLSSSEFRKHFLAAANFFSNY